MASPATVETAPGMGAKIPSAPISFVDRLQYFRRIFHSYLLPGASQLTFWHETPQVNPNEHTDELGEYYMLFAQKADYSGPFDSAGVPMLDYHGQIGRQYNPIAIAQWGLGNYNAFRRGQNQNKNDDRKNKFLLASEWLRSHLEQNSWDVWVWNHNFDWEYLTQHFTVSASRFLKAALLSPMKQAISGLRSTS
jgi:hypothetical protein